MNSSGTRDANCRAAFPIHPQGEHQMRKLVLPVALAASTLSGIATAQQAPAPTPPPPAVTGNMTLVTDYRFRGISQTLGRPAIQGGFDYAHESGLYLGNWNSNVSSAAGYPGGNLEMDFYGGCQKGVCGLCLRLSAPSYYLPREAGGPPSPCGTPLF